MARLLILVVGLAAWKLRFSHQKSLVRNEAIPAFAAQRSGWKSAPTRSADALRPRDHDKATTGRNTVDMQLSDPTQELWNAVDRAFEQWLAPSDEALDHATAGARRAGLPEIAVAPAQGRLLQVIAHSMEARRILEIGTLAGYSAIWLARAARGWAARDPGTRSGSCGARAQQSLPCGACPRGRGRDGPGSRHA